MLFNYDYNDHLRMSFGRYQTAIGYYNSAFHSAGWFQTTADRPLIMEFASDGGLLPTQAVGMSFTGSIPSGRLGLNYVAEYGSSDTIRPSLNGQTLIDENNGNHINIGPVSYTHLDVYKRQRRKRPWRKPNRSICPTKNAISRSPPLS